MAKNISYTNRDFAGIRQDLVQLTKDYYPELINNTNDASIYSVLLDLNAAVADNLHFHIDRNRGRYIYNVRLSRRNKARY